MINSSSKTSTTLKSSRVSNGSPLVRLFQSKIIAFALFVGLLILLIKLGFWQLYRGYDKQELEQQLAYRQQLSPLSAQDLYTTDNFEHLSGRELSITVFPTPHSLIILDNQVHQGQVGYLVFQIMAVSPKEPALLVELGFTPANLDRTQLPQILPFTQKQTLHGRLYYKHTNPVSHELLAEKNNPIRIQNLNFVQLSKLVQQPIHPIVLQAEAITFDANQQPLAKPWNPLPMPANKHFGYAMQWFSMAFALLIIGLILLKRHISNFLSFFRITRSTDEPAKEKK